MRTPDDKRDTTKRCEFHNYHGYDFTFLGMEVNVLSKKGLEREFLSDNAINCFDDDKERHGKTRKDNPNTGQKTNKWPTTITWPLCKARTTNKYINLTSMDNMF